MVPQLQQGHGTYSHKAKKRPHCRCLQARLETADLESEVCRSRAASFHVVPHVSKVRFADRVASMPHTSLADGATGGTDVRKVLRSGCLCGFT